eukprot:1135582-Pleurochrysis_carterae.AAC.1
MLLRKASRHSSSKALYDGQPKRRDIAVLMGRALKFFLRFGSQVRGIGDHRQELEAAFVLVELA